jgi:excisionase family DNA binding protein
MEMKSKREAAEILGVSTRGIERAVRRGHLAVQYRDSKHGKQAWFSPSDLALYKQHQQARAPVGFGPARLGGGAPPVGTLVPLVEMKPWPAKKGDRPKHSNPVPVAERLMLTLAEAAQLSGLPRRYLVQAIRTGSLKALKIGRAQFLKRSELNQFVQNL